MPHSGFVPLRIFSAYTMLEGAIEPKAIATRARELGFPAAALCDRNGLYAAIESLERAHGDAAGASSLPKSAEAYRDKVAPAMLKVRDYADVLEGLVADKLWPLPKYREMLFQY